MIKIDYSTLMDLRIDYAFKLLFTKGDARLLISLLNAIFANKKINRVVKSLRIVNPFLDKESGEDKLSILDIRAELADGTTILIEMHMYGLGELKAKIIRSWARTYGEDLEAGGRYADQLPSIAIAFTNGQVWADDEENAKPKIHRLCKIMDCEDNVVFSNAMELHFIDMKAFAEAVNAADSTNIAEEGMFAKWLSIITQKEINNKAIIDSACNEEEIYMAVTALVRQSDDKIIRQAYQRRKDEIYYHNMHVHRAEEYRKLAAQEQRRAELAESLLADQAAMIAELQKKLSAYDSTK